MSDWIKRINELKQQVNDYWQTLQYTVEDAKDDGMTDYEYSFAVRWFFFIDNENEYSVEEQNYIHDLLREYVKIEWSES